MTVSEFKHWTSHSTVRHYATVPQYLRSASITTCWGMYNRKFAVGHGVRTVTVARRQEVVGVSPKEEELLLLLRCTLVIFMTAIILSTNNNICAVTNYISMCHRDALSKTIVAAWEIANHCSDHNCTVHSRCKRSDGRNFRFTGPSLQSLFRLVLFM